MDNDGPGFSTLSGDWGTAESTDGNGSYGPDFRYILADQTNVARARFAAGVASEGNYEVCIWWSAAPNRTTSQTVIVHDAYGNNTTYHVNLQENGNGWFFLGNHTLSPTDSYVEFNSDTAAAGYCNADAVRFRRR